MNMTLDPACYPIKYMGLLKKSFEQLRVYLSALRGKM